MNNVAAPTVSGPTINLQGVNPNGMFNAVAQTAEIPKVSCVADASRYPAKAGTEDVLLDTNDPDIAYFRKTDVNGFVMVDRRRCIPEPEPTIEEINDRRYLTKEEFQSFREEMMENVRVLTAAVTTFTANAGNGNGKSYNKSGFNKRHGSAGSNVQDSASGTKAVDES